MKWERKSLTDFVWFQRGFDLPKDKFVIGEFPVVGSTSILGYHTEAKVKAPGIVTGRSGTIGQFQFLRTDFWPHNTSLWVKDFKGNDERFAYYLLHTLDFISLNGGGAVPSLNRNFLSSVNVKIPPLPTQRKIATILSAYDDLIENNLKRIKLLEESIRTHYKILMCQNGGSWELQKIEDAYEFSNGYAFYKNGYSEEGKTVIDLGNISESSNLIMTGKEKYVSELLYDDKKKFHLHKYDVIVAMTDMTSRLGILAKVALIDDSNKYILNQRVGRLRSRISYIDHCFLYASLSNEEFRNEMKTKAKGAVQIYFNTKDIIEYEVTLPPIKMIEDFSKVVRPLIDLRFSLNNQNTKLREARDILLPRLMNGQIEV